MAEPSQSWNRQASAKNQDAVSIWKRLLEKPRFELAAEHVGLFRVSDWEDVTCTYIFCLYSCILFIETVYAPASDTDP